MQNLQQWLHGPACSWSVVNSCKLILLENVSMVLDKEELESKTSDQKTDLITVRGTKFALRAGLTVWEEKLWVRILQNRLQHKGKRPAIPTAKDHFLQPKLTGSECQQSHLLRSLQLQSKAVKREIGIMKSLMRGSKG